MSAFAAKAPTRALTKTVASRRAAKSVKATRGVVAKAGGLGTPFTTWILQQEMEENIDGELAVVLSSISLACKQIASLVQRAGIAGMTGLAGETNVQGEDQKKLDVISNDVFCDVFAKLAVRVLLRLKKRMSRLRLRKPLAATTSLFLTRSMVLPTSMPLCPLVLSGVSTSLTPRASRISALKMRPRLKKSAS